MMINRETHPNAYRLLDYINATERPESTLTVLSDLLIAGGLISPHPVQDSISQNGFTDAEYHDIKA